MPKYAHGYGHLRGQGCAFCARMHLTALLYSGGECEAVDLVRLCIPARAGIVTHSICSGSSNSLVVSWTQGTWLCDVAKFCGKLAHL